MKVKQARKLRDILMFAGIFIMLCSFNYVPLLIAGAVVAFSGLIPHFLYNKCHHCGKQLGRSEGEYCQYCGKAVD